MSVIKERLRRDLEAWAKIGIDYSGSPRDLMLRVGRVWKGVKCDLPMGPKKECYTNAGRVALEDPTTWAYVEGLAIRDADYPILIDHGWLLHRPTGEIHDPTWGASDEAEYIGLVFTRRGHALMLVQLGTWDLLTWGSSTDLEKHIEKS
jgi:hypothetical protein